MMLQKRFLILCCLMMVTTLIIPNVLSDSVNAKTYSLTTEEKQERFEEVNNFFTNLNAKKARYAALKRQLDSSTTLEKTENNQEILKLAKEIKYLEENIEKITKLEKVDFEDVGLKFSPSNDGMVAFKYPSLYYDSYFTQSWLISVDFDWGNNLAFFDQMSGTGDLGGYEGFWIGLNREVLTLDSSAQVFDYQEGLESDVTFYEDHSSNGRGWKWQDEITEWSRGGRNYNSHYGMFHFWFEWDDNEPEEDDKVQYFAGYAHTWESTDINSIGIGPYSASIGWSNEGHEWQHEDEWIYTH